MPISQSSQAAQFRYVNGPRVPTGVKIRGANIVPKATDVAMGTSAWISFWGTGYDFTNWIKPQIDNAAAVGANCIRFIGDLGGAITGVFTYAQFLSRAKQVLDYLVSKNLYAYPCGGGLGPISNAQLTGQVPGLLTQFLQLLNQYPNVIGFDVISELMSNGSSVGLNTAAAVGAYATSLSATLRTVSSATDPIPLTFSSPTLTTGSSAQWSDARIALLDPAVDYHDFHVYYSPAAADPNAYVALETTKPFIVGETGTTVSAGTSARTSQMQAVAALAERPDCVGACMWAITDQDTVTSNQWGMFDASFTARPEVTVPFQRIPTTERPMCLQLQVGSSIVLSGATGTYVSEAGTQVTLQFQCPVKVKARVNSSVIIKTAGDVVEGRLSIDGATLDANTALVGNTTGAGNETYLFAQEDWDYWAAAGASHAYKAEWARTVNTGTTDQVLGTRSGLRLEIQRA